MLFSSQNLQSTALAVLRPFTFPVLSGKIPLGADTLAAGHPAQASQRHAPSGSSALQVGRHSKHRSRSGRVVLEWQKEGDLSQAECGFLLERSFLAWVIVPVL